MHEQIKQQWIELGKIHENIRHKIIKWIQEQSHEIKYIDITNFVYETIREMKCSVAFPCGISKNDIAAHDTAFIMDERTFNKTRDIVKIDWGIHREGCIIDSAFTWIPSMCNQSENIKKLTDKEERARKLTREVMSTMLNSIKIDALTYEVAEKAQEIIDSYEDVTCLKNLAGHQIGPWKIHGEYFIPFSTKTKSFFYTSPRFREDDICAVEVFSVADKDPSIQILKLEDTNHFIWKNKNLNITNLLPYTKKLINNIARNHDFRLPWTFQFQDKKYSRYKESKIATDLFLNHCIEPYPPIMTPTGSVTFQYEDTIIINENPINLTNVIKDPIFK